MRARSSSLRRALALVAMAAFTFPGTRPGVAAAALQLREVWRYGSGSPFREAAFPVRAQKVSGHEILLFEPDGTSRGPLALRPEQRSAEMRLHDSVLFTDFSISPDGSLVFVDTFVGVRDEPALGFLRAFDARNGAFLESGLRAVGAASCILAAQHSAIFATTQSRDRFADPVRLDVSLAERRLDEIQVTPVWSDTAYTVVVAADVNERGDLAALVRRCRGGCCARPCIGGPRNLEYAFLFVGAGQPPRLAPTNLDDHVRRIALSADGRWLAAPDWLVGRWRHRAGGNEETFVNHGRVRILDTATLRTPEPTCQLLDCAPDSLVGFHIAALAVRGGIVAAVLETSDANDLRLAVARAEGACRTISLVANPPPPPPPPGPEPAVLPTTPVLGADVTFAGDRSVYVAVWNAATSTDFLARIYDIVE